MFTRFALCFSLVIVAVTFSGASISTSPSDAQLKLVNQPGAPANMSKVVILNDDGRGISLIRYRVLNETSRNLRRVFLKLVFFDRFGKPLGGEVFSEQMDLKGHRHAEFLTPLKHYAGDGVAKVAVIVSQVETNKDTWKDTSTTKQILDGIIW